MRFNKIKFAFVLAVASVGLISQAYARPYANSNAPGTGPNNGDKNSLLKSAADCKPAEADIDLDINNVRARLMTGGDMWWDIGTTDARYEVPKGSGKHSLFAGSVWVGGIDKQGQLKVAAQTYRQDGNDYWPGPLDKSAQIDAATCALWDRFWKVNRTDINKFRELSSYGSAKGNPDFDAIVEWPAKGNEEAKGNGQNNLFLGTDVDYAPFVDVNADGRYNYADGDYPDIDGDQLVWWVFNDKGNIKNQSNTEGIGIEVQASAFAYSTKDFLNDATFYNFRLINRGNLTLDSTFIATWTDADLGYYLDDYIGCDTLRGLGILYNGTSVDGTGAPNHYGDRVPMVGIDFFKGPKRKYDSAGQAKEEILGMEAFTYYNNDFTVIGNPRNGIEIYYYMTGSIRNGQRFSVDWNGQPQPSQGFGTSQLTKYVFYGEPETASWSECYCNNPVSDRRFVHSAGPFTLEPGVTNDITIGAIWVADVGGCPQTSFKKIRVADDQAQALFDNNFQTIEGPEAPRMEVREMDRKLVFYLVNDSNSNNFQERYGYDTAAQYRVASIKAARYVRHPDSLYKFEGYRVFQLKNEQVTPAQIFNDRGEVDEAMAREVFQCDIRNGISRIINYEKATDISDTTWIPRVKVEGADSGIRHSFEITQDQFATGSDKRIVNYRNYYFVAIAYAYNQFMPFDPNSPDSTQDLAYLESSKAANGSNIPVVAGMPNPSNGAMGTVLNADYGTGVIIRRMEGRGNGGNYLQLSDSSENAMLGATPYVAQPTYREGEGPVDIFVVDPLKVTPASYELYIEPGPGRTQIDSQSIWRLVNLTTNETVYSEQNLSRLNEQIVEKYGLSVALKQVGRPGDDQINGNGLISSSIIFTDEAYPWLMGVPDGEAKSKLNWIRSGNTTVSADPGETLDCNFDDYTRFDSAGQFYESLLPNNVFTEGTWAPYALTVADDNSICGLGFARKGTQTLENFQSIQSVDIVFTSDKSKWTRSAVIELQDDEDLAQGFAPKFKLRSHRSWNLDIDENGRPVYSTDPTDTGMSWFPGYAINQETGERLNIVFGEDSWLGTHNGRDLIWNPTSTALGVNNSVVYGGKHIIYVLSSRYDGGKEFVEKITDKSTFTQLGAFSQSFMWVGAPLVNPGYPLRSLEEGLIPQVTRLKFRVTRPYAKYSPPGVELRNNGFPRYSFSTEGLAPIALSDNMNADKQALLDRIHVVPNPYYAYAGYERNRLDTRVRIINLPKTAAVSIYSLDGSLIRRLEKDNPNVAYIDWDVRNFKGLPIASGMYLIHVEAEGIGETVIRWFGAMRPIDITNY